MDVLRILLLMECFFILNAAAKSSKKEDVTFPTAKELPQPDSFEVQEETPDFLEAAANGELSRRRRLEEDQRLAESNIVAEPNSATGVHQLLLSSSSEAQNLSLNAIAIEAASKTFLNIQTFEGDDGFNPHSEPHPNSVHPFNPVFKPIDTVGPASETFKPFTPASENIDTVGLASETFKPFSPASENIDTVGPASETFKPFSPVIRNIGKVGLSKTKPCPPAPSPISIFPQTQFGQKHCYSPISCDTTAIYRTFDGSCNNLWFPLVGKATTPFTRLLYPAYDDCIDDPRKKSITGTDLPCAREVSQMLGSCPGNKNTANTMMVMQWGQFIDHDLAFSPTAKLSYSGQSIKCCDATPLPIHSECFPICIAPDDPYYSCFDKTCMNFVRTLSAPSIWCNFGPREQVNDLSHFLDGSMIYGSSDGTANSLRTFSGGRLKVQIDQDKYDILPDETISSCKPDPNNCFRAGDGRVNEQPNLAITHTLWMREHNRIADFFHKKKFSDEKAYQEARKLVIAEIQHITYNEFLPVVLGNIPSLKPGPKGSYFSFYSPFTDSRISNEFATAAFRFGHSLLDDHIEKHWLQFSLPIQLPLSSLFSHQGLNHFWGNRNLFEFGLTRQHPEKVDMCFTKEVTQKLFEEAGIPGSGLDLVALNIQRGRDHGLPPYVEYRNNFCNSNHKIHNFNDMTWLTPTVLTLLSSVYSHVEDVDLFVGGLLEPNQPGALVGETFQCIMRDQFYRLKEGDRFFYENNIQPQPFKTNQLNEIKKKVSLARIFCDNGDKITKIQSKVFSSSPKSDLKNCNGKKSIPKLNLKLFV